MKQQSSNQVSSQQGLIQELLRREEALESLFLTNIPALSKCQVLCVFIYMS